MPRPRYSDSDSTTDSDNSSSDQDRSRRPRSVSRSSKKDRERFTGRGDSSSGIDDSDTEDSDSDSNVRKRLKRSKPSASSHTERSLSTSAPPPYSETPPDSSRKGLKCFLGITLALILVAVGGYALYTWRQSAKSNEAESSSSDSEAGAKTVTVTEKGSDTATASPSSESNTVSIKAQSDSNSTTSSSLNSTSSSSSSSSSKIVLNGLSRNNIGIGWLPDYANQDMTKITDGLGIKSSFYGWYAQLPESDEWDGAQLLSQMDDLKACNCIFQPAVMPTKGWKGLTESDNFQALAIAKIMKKFTDEGIEVQLRFAHEVNWYQEDGTYKGTADDFKQGWAAVAAAVKDNDKVKMFFTPNIAAKLENYVAYMPDDLSTVHLLGIDYYPSSSTESFVEHMKPLYDKYCQDGSILFAIGETGNGWEGGVEERLTWMDQCTSAETAKAMPYYIGVSWFNYDKEREFRLFIENESDVNDAAKKWFSDTEGMSTEGATAGNA